MGYYFVVTPRTLAQRLIHCVGEDGNDDHGQHAPEHKLALFSYRGVDADHGPAHVRAKLAASSIFPTRPNF
jgi:hypothetical protein